MRGLDLRDGRVAFGALEVVDVLGGAGAHRGEDHGRVEQTRCHHQRVVDDTAAHRPAQQADPVAVDLRASGRAQGHGRADDVLGVAEAEVHVVVGVVVGAGVVAVVGVSLSSSSVLQTPCAARPVVRLVVTSCHHGPR